MLVKTKTANCRTRKLSLTRSGLPNLILLLQKVLNSQSLGRNIHEATCWCWSILGAAHPNLHSCARYVDHAHIILFYFLNFDWMV